MAELRNLLAAEWLKLSRRPLAWVLLAVFLLLMVLYLSAWFLIVALHEGAIGPGEARFDLLRPEQLAELKRQLSFPGIFGAVLGQVNSTGGICAIILAAGLLGSDYGWGTLRTTLIRAPYRGRLLLAKLLALLLALLAGIIIALIVGALLALAYGAALHLPARPSGGGLLLLPLGVLRALYVLLPYVLATLACAALGRSVLAGAGGGLIFLALDVSAGSVGAFGAIDARVQFLINLLLQPNITTMVVLNGALYGLDQAQLVRSLDLSALPSPLQATLVIAAYCGFFFWSAYRLLRRRDVSGAQ
jgi:ABC-type transport system involved in multi-copper enzyme maturation permease subunit